MSTDAQRVGGGGVTFLWKLPRRDLVSLSELYIEKANSLGFAYKYNFKPAIARTIAIELYELP